MNNAPGNKEQQQPAKTLLSKKPEVILLADLSLAAMIVYWTLEGELPDAWQIAAICGIIGMLMTATLMARAHYGPGSLRGTLIFAVGVSGSISFLSSTVFFRRELLLLIISHFIWFFGGALIGILNLSRERNQPEEKRSLHQSDFLGAKRDYLILFAALLVMGADLALTIHGRRQNLMGSFGPMMLAWSLVNFIALYRADKRTKGE